MNGENLLEGAGVHTSLTIDFKALFMELLDKAIIIILAGIASVLVSFLLFSTIMHLNYESTTKIYIKPESSGSNAAYVSLEIGTLLTTDYSEMIVGRDILEDTIQHFGLDTTYERFVHKVTVDNPTDTRILYITVKDKDPYLARNMAGYIRDRAIDEIETSMGNEGISIIEQANLPIKTTPSNTLLSVLFGMVVMFLVAVAVIIRYLIIDTIVSADDVESRMNLMVLGTIAYEKGKL